MLCSSDVDHPWSPRETIEAYVTVRVRNDTPRSSLTTIVYRLPMIVGPGGGGPVSKSRDQRWRGGAGVHGRPCTPDTQQTGTAPGQPDVNDTVVHQGTQPTNTRFKWAIPSIFGGSTIGCGMTSALVHPSWAITVCTMAGALITSVCAVLLKLIPDESVHKLALLKAFLGYREQRRRRLVGQRTRQARPHRRRRSRHSRQRRGLQRGEQARDQHPELRAQ